MKANFAKWGAIINDMVENGSATDSATIGTYAQTGNDSSAIVQKVKTIVDDVAIDEIECHELGDFESFSIAWDYV